MEGEYRTLIKRIKELKKQPKDIVFFKPLRENLFTIFVAVYSRTPLFICGKPGSSKSIAVDIAKNTFNGQVLGNCPFDGLEQIWVNYFQGSDQSTDKGVERAFTSAQKRNELGKDIQLFFFDEMGLAEISPHNPLKVLHTYLDSTHSNGISQLFKPF